MAGRTFSAISMGTFTRTVSPSSSLLSTRTWIHWSVFEEVCAADGAGKKAQAPRKSAPAKPRKPRERWFMVNSFGNRYGQWGGKVPREEEILRVRSGAREGVLVVGSRSADFADGGRSAAVPARP